MKPNPFTHPDLPALLDQSELASYLGKSEAWCERARWTGDGPKFIKLGRHVRYKVSDIQSWLQASESHNHLKNSQLDSGEI